MPSEKSDRAPEKPPKPTRLCVPVVHPVAVALTVTTPLAEVVTRLPVTLSGRVPDR